MGNSREITRKKQKQRRPTELSALEEYEIMPYYIRENPIGRLEFRFVVVEVDLHGIKP